MYKLAVLAFLALYLPCLMAQDEFINIAPGAVCQVWLAPKGYSLKPFVEPKQPARGYFVDRAAAFSKANLKNSPELAPLASEKVLIAWTGFIRIQQAGQYTFSLDARAQKDLPETLVQLNDKPILESSHTDGYYSLPITLTPGMMRITIYLHCQLSQIQSITLRYKNSAETAPVKLSPATLFYQTQESPADPQDNTK